MANKLKLLKRNLKLPLEHRISIEEVESRERIARVRGNNAALRLQIELEIKPKLEAMREAEDFIQNRRGEFQGYVTNHEDGHYSNVYSLADSNRAFEPDLANENDARFACIVESQKIVENKRKEMD